MSHVLLIGFMGAGKSAVGRSVAERLGRPFIDLDEEIERIEGAAVPELFEQRGEAGFRAAERAALERLTDAADAVVATGGGVVLREDNRALLRRLGTVVYLAVTPEQALARLGEDHGRPLLEGLDADGAARLLESRLPLYEAVADHVVDTDGRTVDEVATAVVALVRARGPHVIEVAVAGGRGYRVVIGSGLIDQVGTRVREAVAPASVALVTDDVVGPLYRRRVAASLAEAGIRVSEHTVPAGERSKSWERAGALLERFAASGLERGSAVIALGGGVVGDLAGFCAATYMRGIPVVHVPTTLLAQVDSSIGGKTAVDLEAGKNLAGAIWPPALVLADVETLQTLPEPEWVSGMVEVVKTALLAGEDAVDRLDMLLDEARTGEVGAVMSVVADAAAFKARVVSADEREAGLRECLNFGHTLGHALEAVAGYGVLSHGMAVAEGLRFAMGLSEDLIGAPRELSDRVDALLNRAGAARLLTRFDPQALLAKMKSDKKARGDVVRFVLLKAPGEWHVVGIGDDVLRAALQRWASRDAERGS